MKKIFLMLAASMFAFAGCTEPGEFVPIDDTIALDYSGALVDAKGGFAEIVVESSIDWIVSSVDSDWAEAVTLNGKSGDVAMIEIGANITTGERAVEITFMAGNAAETIKITQLGVGQTPDDPVLNAFELVSPSAPVATFDQTSVYVKMNVGAAINVAGIQVEMNIESGGDVEGQGQWIKYDGARRVGDETLLYFTLLKNPTLSTRRANATVKAAKDTEIGAIALNFAQTAEAVFELISTTPVANALGVFGISHDGTEDAWDDENLNGKVVVKVKTNLEEAGMGLQSGYSWSKKPINWGWVEAQETTGDNEMIITFVFQEFDAEAPANYREFEVSMIPIDDSFDPINFKFAQVPDAVEVDVFNFGTGSVTLPTTFDKLNFFATHSDFSVEFLVKLNSQPTANRGIFGRNDIFNFRIGDVGTNRKYAELSFRSMYAADGWNGENKTVPLVGVAGDASMNITADEWKHVAITYDLTYVSGPEPPAQDATTKSHLEVKVYFDGVHVGGWKSSEPDGGAHFARNLSASNDIAGNFANRATSIGTATGGSAAGGQFSEVRIWNKVLTAVEIASSGHFYSVPADSEGLVAYWKMNEGENMTFADSTTNGYNLTATSGTWAKGLFTPSLVPVE